MSVLPIFSILFMGIGLSAALSKLAKIWPNKLYKECQKISGSNEFEEMIKQLSQESTIPILAKAEAHTAQWDAVNYPNHLKEMQSFMNEVNSHNEALKHPPQGKGHADEFPETTEGLAHNRASIFRFTTHRKLLDIMDLKCGKKVCKNVLEDALVCAECVRETQEKEQQKMLEGKKQKGNKKTLEMWTDLNKAFKENLQKICGPKGEKKDD